MMHPYLPCLSPVYPKLCCCLLLALVVAGCQAPSPAQTPVATSRIDDSPRALLRKARHETGPSAASLRLRAATAYATRADFTGLALALKDLDAAVLEPADRWRLALLNAHLSFSRGDPASAAAHLEKVPHDRSSSVFEAEELVFLSRLRVQLHESLGHPLAATHERIYLDGLLPVAERPANRAAIWQTLMGLDIAAIETARAEAARQTELLGWLELAQIARSRYPTLEAQQYQVELWLQRWQDHSASDPLPEQLVWLSQLIVSRPQHVALLLPLTGDLAGAGKAIRDGFIASQFEAARTGAFTPQISVINSAERGADTGYLDAVADGAEFVIGPLAKTSVDAVAKLEVREVPVLALNTTSDDRTAPNLIQFALLPEAEGVQLAEQLHTDGLDYALLLIQSAPWTKRIAQAFQIRFASLGGTLVQHQPFASAAAVDEAVSAALLIPESEERARSLRRLLGSAFEFEPRRRRDVQAVVALADTVHGSILRPALEYYFAGNLPVYASSKIYDPSAPTAISGDSPLMGIRFCDMPWRLLPLNTRQLMDKAWPDLGASLSTFQAIGVDAWRLHAQFAAHGQSRTTEPIRLAGVTGDLELMADGRIRRQLTCAIMGKQGPRPLPSLIATHRKR